MKKITKEEYLKSLTIVKAYRDQNVKEREALKPKTIDFFNKYKDEMNTRLRICFGTQILRDYKFEFVESLRSGNDVTSIRNLGIKTFGELQVLLDRFEQEQKNVSL